jgi:hypothetical protein
MFDEALVSCEKIFAELQVEAPDALKMISRRANYMINSWMHNLPALKRPRQLTKSLYMHPDDARAHDPWLG